MVLMSEKHKTSIQLTAEAKALLQLLAQHFGVSQSAIIELAIREKAVASGLPRLPSLKKGDT